MLKRYEGVDVDVTVVLPVRLGNTFNLTSAITKERPLRPCQVENSQHINAQDDSDGISLRLRVCRSAGSEG